MAHEYQRTDGTTVLSLSTTETAKVVRKVLKRTWPGVKFSVRSKSYAGGSSVSVNYEDGPTEREVRDTISRYGGATFDGMIDLKEYKEAQPIIDQQLRDEIEAAIGGPIGERVVSWGPDWVTPYRELSEATKAKIIHEVEALTGTDYIDGMTDIYREVAIDRETGELFKCTGMSYDRQPFSGANLVHMAGHARSL